MKKDKIKELFVMAISEMLWISVILLLAIGLMKLICHDFEPWPWYLPFQIVGVSIPTSLCSMIYYNKKELNRKQFIIRAVIHLFLLLFIVLGEGYLFKWWVDLEDIIIVLIVFIFVYASVWIVTYIGDKKNSDKINKALKNRRRDEE